MPTSMRDNVQGLSSLFQTQKKPTLKFCLIHTIAETDKQLFCNMILLLGIQKELALFFFFVVLFSFALSTIQFHFLLNLAKSSPV